MNIQTFDSATAVAETAAKYAVDTLHDAINTHGNATWVLAGGTTPSTAYEILADSYLDRLDWSSVTFILGDERIGPLNGPDNNWQIIEELFLRHIPDATFIRPHSDTPAQQAAATYEKQLRTLPTTHDSQVPRFDLVWLGMGPDGHTLSLFPEHKDFNPNDTRLVVPVYDSPKPPSDRISLTLHALRGSQNTVIIATGENKRDALKHALSPDCSLPIAHAARTHADTLWLLDEAAKP